MEELITQTQRELIDLPSVWAKSGLSERRVVLNALPQWFGGLTRWAF